MHVSVERVTLPGLLVYRIDISHSYALEIAKGVSIMSVDYLLHESSVGYAIFQVVHQPDTVGNRLKEVQDSVQVSRNQKKILGIYEIFDFSQDLAKFGKMVKLVSFAPFQ